MRTQTLVVVGIVATAAAAGVAVHASSSDPVGTEGSPSRTLLSGAPVIDPCPLDIRDFLPVRMYEEGVTLELAAESVRLRAELIALSGPPDPAVLARLPPSAEQLRGWACEALAKQAEEHHRWMRGEREEPVAPPLPDRTTCSRYCRLFTSCGGATERAADDPWNCIDACTAGGFGRQDWVQRVNDFEDCRYL